jgi:hypothetical protein
MLRLSGAAASASSHRRLPLKLEEESCQDATAGGEGKHPQIGACRLGEKPNKVLPNYLLWHPHLGVES